jgi:hypothetical protein
VQADGILAGQAMAELVLAQVDPSLTARLALQRPACAAR